MTDKKKEIENKLNSLVGKMFEHNGVPLFCEKVKFLIGCKGAITTSTKTIVITEQEIRALKILDLPKKNAPKKQNTIIGKFPPSKRKRVGGAKKIWKQEDIEFIKKNFQEYSIPDFMKHFDESRFNVINMVRFLELVKIPKKKTIPTFKKEKGGNRVPFTPFEDYCIIHRGYKTYNELSLLLKREANSLAVRSWYLKKTKAEVVDFNNHEFYWGFKDLCDGKLGWENLTIGDTVECEKGEQGVIVGNSRHLTNFCLVQIVNKVYSKRGEILEMNKYKLKRIQTINPA